MNLLSSTLSALVNQAHAAVVTGVVAPSRWPTRTSAVLPAGGIPAGPVNDLTGALALAERLGLDPVVRHGGVPTVANPITLSRTPVQYRLGPPAAFGDRSSGGTDG